MKLLVLFGSRARGTAAASSDADVAFLPERFEQVLTLDDLSKLQVQMAEQLNLRDDQIDLADLRVASPLLQQQVATTGRLLEGKEEDWLRFRVLAWKRYQDTAKFRRAREYALSQRYGN